MNVLGIITEYNPFHNGHNYHIEQALNVSKATHTVCVMSGHFLQRGIPSILNKWERAEMCLHSNVDLVIELPTLFSLNSAEFFSEGSIKLLDSLGIVDSVVFGSEDGNIDSFKKVSAILANEPDDFKALLKKHLNQGMSFPAAREKALINYLEEDIIQTGPNNNLGIEYCKALKKIDSSIRPQTIKRMKADYNDLKINGSIASASAIRKSLLNDSLTESLSEVMPQKSYEILKKNKDQLVFSHNFEDLILYKLRSIKSSDIQAIHDVTEGLEHRIKEASIYANSLENLIERIKCKRYTYTRIQRILFKTLLNITKDQMSKTPQYIRILGFNQRGQELLKAIKEKSSLPIITNLKHYVPQNNQAKYQIDLDITATNIYNLFRNKKTGGLDYTNHPVIITNNTT